MARDNWHDFGNGTFALTGGSNIGAIVQGGRALLVDAGLDRDAARKALRPLEARKIGVAAVAITHGHADHFGGAAWASQRTGAPVYAPPLEGVYAAHPLLEPLFLHGGAAPITELTGKFTLAREATEIPHPLAGGRYDIEGVTIEVIELGGHAPEQVGIATVGDAQSVRTCYCGDAVFPKETLERHPILFCSDLDAWLATLDRLTDFEADIYVAGHGEPVRDVAPLVRATGDRLNEIRDVVLGALDQPTEPHNVLRAVAKHFDVTFSAPQFFLLSLTTVNAALTSLQRHGYAEIAMEDNRFLWRRGH